MVKLYFQTKNHKIGQIGRIKNHKNLVHYNEETNVDYKICNWI
jgi:hypothetical protein